MNDFILQENNVNQCPVCSGIHVTESEKLETFLYGENHEEIQVLLPVSRCSSCNFEFTDDRAEALRQEAVYDHHNLLYPTQIAAVRKSLGMSRREFQNAYGISCASMERWENGRLFQSESIDTLLRLLQDHEQARKHDRRHLARHEPPATNVVYVDFQTRALGETEFENAKLRSRQFSLNGRS